MSTRLIILGLLQRKNLYGYEIKHIIEEHMGDWTSVAFGSIYFALAQLEKENLIRKISEEKKGRRPARSIYEISESGRKEFLILLTDVWKEAEPQYFSIDVALFFMRALPIDKVKQFIALRVNKLEKLHAYLLKHKQEQLADKNIPRLAQAIFDHSRLHMEAELVWLKDLLQKIEEGVYK
ncbi:MAG: helix-turn-helix transcriptional regulator [Spirochaetales bacterium]|nr:helix-turn-helix transcriptional regulator [Spirochaetales bacterium]